MPRSRQFSPYGTLIPPAPNIARRSTGLRRNGPFRGVGSTTSARPFRSANGPKVNIPQMKRPERYWQQLLYGSLGRLYQRLLCWAITGYPVQLIKVCARPGYFRMGAPNPANQNSWRRLPESAATEPDGNPPVGRSEPSILDDEDVTSLEFVNAASQRRDGCFAMMVGGDRECPFLDRQKCRAFVLMVGRAAQAVLPTPWPSAGLVYWSAQAVLPTRWPSAGLV